MSPHTAYITSPISSLSKTHPLILSTTKTTTTINSNTSIPFTSISRPLSQPSLQSIISTPLSNPPSPPSHPTRILYLFRNDLRIHDNQALSKACQYASSVPTGTLVPVYFQSTNDSSYTKNALSELKASLMSLGSDLIVPNAHDISQTILNLCDRLKLTAVFFNRSIFSKHVIIEQRIIQSLKSSDIEVHTFWDNMLIDPNQQLLNSKHTPKQIDLQKNLPKQIPLPLQPLDQIPSIPSAAYTAVPTSKINSQMGKGTTIALKLLTSMKKDTELLKIEKTTQLAISLKPYLDVGAISPKMVVARITQVVGKPVGRTFSELVWRDYIGLVVNRAAGVKSVKQTVMA